ncbi:M15 family metallopeptidase [Pseudidiomarina marina]|uniref:M15 family metallopeptidase n=1 Tax=Pseudidiomarina marina TaxID=502366 RepID=UPI000F876F62|nr:M15 family metallopeptidase [Pseudidiomarina marina]
MLTLEQLYGINSNHTEQIAGERDGVRLQEPVAQAYIAMRDAAADAGITMAIASAFRDFERQRTIWNRKFNGEAPLYNDRGELLDATNLSVGEKIEAILTWSALPGASRHHWGTDFDVYDPTPFSTGERKLELIPAEYQESGPCYELHQWLIKHARDFGFFFPYARYQGGVAAEPWHLSQQHLANQAHAEINVEQLTNVLTKYDVAGREYVIEQLAEIKHRYIDSICNADITSGDIWFG